MPLMLRLVGEGYPLCLPVMQGKGKPLVFRRWQPGDELAETTWGIREPLPEAPEVVPDVVLAALLAFDLHGYRLGYGGGFYDPHARCGARGEAGGRHRARLRRAAGRRRAASRL